MKEVAVLGASNSPERYSSMCMTMLGEHGHLAIPVNPKESMVHGHYCYKDLKELKKNHQGIDTLTIYVNPKISSSMIQDIVDLAPRRVIFNPGSENAELEDALRKKGIQTMEACSLVLLRTNQF